MTETLKSLFGSIPRDLGFPERRMVKSYEEMMELINLHNGKTTVFVSCYQSDLSNQFEKTIVDKVFFDFDGEGSFEQMNKIHTFLARDNILHIIFFSGAGYHIHVLTTNGEKLKNPRQSIWNYQDALCKSTGAKMDEAVKGDLARLCRIPGTWNVRRRKFCIPLAHEDLAKGHDWIIKKADEFDGHLRIESFGQTRLDIKQFDSEPDTQMTKLLVLDESKLQNVDEVVKLVPKCIQNMLLTPTSNFRMRFHIITFLKDFGYSQNDVIEILRKHLTPEKFRHAIFEERQVQYIFKKDIMFSDCSVLKKEGLACVDCKCHSLYK